jgi:phenylacetic acid degradation operon negative regulatory protein
MAEPTAERTSQLLTTLLGGYWFANDGFVPSAAIAAVLAEFGIGAEAARAALSRSSRRGRLEGTRSGRTTAYRLAPGVRDRAVALSRSLMGFGAVPVAWDGTWTCVAFSVPEADRPRRLALRRRLRELGFGVLFDGLWISPRAPVAEVDAALGELGIATAAVLRVTEVARPDGVDLLAAWDLDALRHRYDGFLTTVRRVGPRLAAGEIGSAEALVTRTEVLAGWRDLVTHDPGLPDELLPAAWPRAEARRCFVEVYDGLGPLAEARVQQLVAPHPATPLPHHHRVADILAL